MITNLLLSLRFCRNYNQLAGKTILLSYASPFVRYTFLSIQTKNLSSAIDEMVVNLKSKQLKQIVCHLRNSIYLLNSVSHENYSYVDLQKVVKGQQGMYQNLNKYKKEIKQISEKYGDLVQKICKQINRYNIHMWMDICLKLEIVDLRVWNQLLRNCTQFFEYQSETIKQKVIQFVSQFLKQKFMIYTRSPSKFIYRQNFLIDISCLQDAIFLFLRQVFKYKEVSIPQKQASLQLIIEMVQKVKRTGIVNTHRFISQIQSNKKAYLQICEQCKISTAVSLLKFLSILGLLDQSFINKIEQRIIKLANNSKKEILNTQNINLIKKLLEAWSLLSYHNETIYSMVVKPSLIKLMQQFKDQQKNQHQLSTFLYNLISCNIKDIDLFKQLIHKASEFYPIHNQIQHIVNHYLSVQYGFQKLSSYPLCFQNKLALQIAKKNGKIYSNCMERQQQSHPRHEPYRSNSLTHNTALGIQMNPTEQFWLIIVRKVFNKLSDMYPHPKNQILINFKFCVFQIDALLVINQQYIAFEYEGSHYHLKNVNKSSNEAKTGKKNIKQKIIKSYGIKILKIDSLGLIERTIVSFKDYEVGVKYLLQKFDKLYKQKA